MENQIQGIKLYILPERKEQVEHPSEDLLNRVKNIYDAQLCKNGQESAITQIIMHISFVLTGYPYMFMTYPNAQDYTALVGKLLDSFTYENLPYLERQAIRLIKMATEPLPTKEVKN